jgi:hypothetical protein
LHVLGELVVVLNIEALRVGLRIGDDLEIADASLVTDQERVGQDLIERQSGDAGVSTC